MNEPGRDLSVPAGPGLPSGLTIPAEELVERFSRSSGPGGHHPMTEPSLVLAAQRHLKWRWLDPLEANGLLRAYAIPAAPVTLAHDAEEAAAAARPPRAREIRCRA